MSAKPPPFLGRWIGLAALTVLAVGIGAAWRQWSPGAAPPPAAAPAPDTTGEERIQEALVQADQDEKNRWVSEVPGVEVSDLDDRRHALFLQVVNARRCTCGCGYTLAACRVHDTTCEVSLPRVEALLDSVRRGLVAALPEPEPGAAPALPARR